MNSKEFYPLSREYLAKRLGYGTWTGLYQRKPHDDIPNELATFIGNKQMFNEEVVDILRSKGYSCKRLRAVSPGTVTYYTPRRTYLTPHGKIRIDSHVPLPVKDETPAAGTPPKTPAAGTSLLQK